ncbi:uncharacterized protein LOC122065457 [Macadamia integrifolia]|uniref:uncharacterized protein LOC122065457 n=1 Tax=Macadamia integrifolia TaxID=60698 RepID=UPI001C4EABA1|nr:uncharacterized protein LOC122065457 [Macadamia integrifolia]
MLYGQMMTLYDQELEAIEDAMLFTSIIVLTESILGEEEEEENEATLQIERQRVHTCPFTGHIWISEILHPNTHPRRVRRLFRMSRDHFMRLVDALKERKLVKDTNNITVEEQLAMSIMIMAHNVRNSIIQERFQHSGETVSRVFHNILRALNTYARELIQPPSFNEIPAKIRGDRRYHPYFDNCIGAIDGTHVNASIPVANQIPYGSGRKKETIQNVLVVCDFDMCFTFIWVGWEGTTHDSRILWEALHRQSLKFPHPPEGKYYLIDLGFSNVPGYLAPFKNVHYHKQDYNHRRPQRAKERFNHTHSSLRSTIEKCFCILKKRFPVLKTMPSYQFRAQVEMVIACVAIHNFIRKQQANDWLFDKYDCEDFSIIDNNHDNEENTRASGFPS